MSAIFYRDQQSQGADQRRTLALDDAISHCRRAALGNRSAAKKRQATSTGGAHPQLTPKVVEADLSSGEAVKVAAKIVGASKTLGRRKVLA